MNEYKIDLSYSSRIKWLVSIADGLDRYGNKVKPSDVIRILLPTNCNKLGAVHFASLACMIEYFYRKHCLVNITSASIESVSFFIDILKWQSYWAGNQEYIQANDDNIMNLWRVAENGIELYARRVYNFLKCGRFKQKDLTPVLDSLLEAYYNIFGHAETDIAFSFIHYIEKEEKLSVAICDLGEGNSCNSKREKARHNR